VSALSQALLAELDDDGLAELALKLAPYLPQPGPAEADRWMTTREAAEYLGMSVNALHKLTAARKIPFEQDTPGGKCWFLKSELDRWRRT
jgi:excisionase family DNA binding protein